MESIDLHLLPTLLLSAVKYLLRGLLLLCGLLLFLFGFGVFAACAGGGEASESEFFDPPSLEKIPAVLQRALSFFLRYVGFGLFVAMGVSLLASPSLLLHFGLGMSWEAGLPVGTFIGVIIAFTIVLRMEP